MFWCGGLSPSPAKSQTIIAVGAVGGDVRGEDGDEAVGELDNARMLEARLRNAGLDRVDVLLADGAAPHRVVVGVKT